MSSTVLNGGNRTTSVLIEQVNRFLAKREPRLRPDSYKHYKHALERVFLPWCESQGIDDAREVIDQVMYQFTDHLRSNERHLSVGSIASYLRPIRAFLTWEQVPRGGFKAPRAREPFLEPLSRHEIEAMLEAARSERDRLILRVLWRTGVWVSELLDLRLSDLKRKDNHKTYLRVRGRVGVRDVPVDPELFDDVRRLAEAAGNAYIFMTMRGSGPNNRLTRNAVGRIINDLASAAGVRRGQNGARSRVSPLLLRQSFAVRWLEGRGSPIDLMAVLGHNSLQMVDRLYARLALSDPFDEMMRLRSAGAI